MSENEKIEKLTNEIIKLRNMVMDVSIDMERLSKYDIFNADHGLIQNLLISIGDLRTEIDSMNEDREYVEYICQLGN